MHLTLKLKIMFHPRLKHGCFSSLHTQSFKVKFLSSSSSPSSSSLQFSTWSGLQQWRDGPLNENRYWGPNGPEPLQNSPAVDNQIDSASSLAELGALVLSTSDPLSKSKLSHLAFSKWRNLNLPIGVSVPPSRPARPPIPQLVCFFVFFQYLSSIFYFTHLLTYLKYLSLGFGKGSSCSQELRFASQCLYAA